MMDHPSYLELHHELVTKVLPEIALRQSREDNAGASDLMTRLQAKLDDLWAQRVATASATVAP